MLTQRLLIRGPEVRRKYRPSDGCAVSLDLHQIIVVNRIAECTAQMCIRKHTLEIHAEHIDTHTRDLMDLVFVILKETAARTVAPLDVIHIARLQCHRALVVILDVLDRKRVKPGGAVPIALILLELNLLVLLEADNLIGARQHRCGIRFREIRLRVDDNKGRLRQCRNERTVRLRRLDEEVLSVHLDLLDLRGLLRARALLQRTLERCLDELRRHRLTILELHILTDVETPRRRVDRLPLVGKLRCELHLVRNRDKRLTCADARHRPAVPLMRRIDGLTEPIQGSIQMLARSLLFLRAAAREKPHHQEHQSHEHIHFFHGFSPSFPQKLR